MLVYTPYQPRQSLYKDLSIPLTSSFSSTSPSQNLQPLAMTHPDRNPFKPSGIFPCITYSAPLKLKPQARPHNEPSHKKKDKESLYQLPDPTIVASSKPLDMNMLVVDPGPPNPISSFLKNLTLKDPREPFVLLVIDVIDLDLSNLGLEEVFITDNQPTIEEDDVLCPKPPPPIFPSPPFVPNTQTCLNHPSTADSKHLFTIDNAPSSKWHNEFFNMYSWCTAELQALNSIVAQVIAKFVARLTGRLREWWINLGEFRQRQVAQCKTLEDFFTIIHNEFLGSPTHYI